MGHPSTRIIAAIALSAAVLAGCTSTLSATHGSTARGGQADGALPLVLRLPAPLHVAHPRTGTPYIADRGGRQIQLRGVALVGMEDIAYTGGGHRAGLYPVNAAAYTGKCPAVSPLGSEGPACEVQASRPPGQQSAAPGSHDDFAQIRALGMNVVRLVLDWSELEPTPGHYSAEYLQRVAQVVGWAQQQGISVILDMHEDQYSRFILPKTSGLPSGCTPSGGYDGAPRWAVFTDGEPSCAQYGQSDLNPAVAAAFDNFWHNRIVPGPQGQAPGRGLQDHYIGALAALAKKFDSSPAVIGYEIMNEPLPGAHAAVPLTNVVTFSNEQLYPFYRRAIEAITGVRDGLATCPTASPSGFSAAGPPPYSSAPHTPCAYPDLGVHTSRIVFFEPCAYRNLLDFSPQANTAFSSYDNLVFAPHVYTHAFTLDSFVGQTPGHSAYPPTYTFGYQTAIGEARAMHAAVFTTEFGDGASTDKNVLTGEIAAQDRAGIGGTLWAWDGLSAAEPNCWCVRFEQSAYATTQNGTAGSGDPHAQVATGKFIPSRVALLAQPLPVAVAGRLLAWVSDPVRHSFSMVGEVTPRSMAGTQVEIPVAWRGATVTAGKLGVHLQVEAGGARLATVLVSTPGRYVITVAMTSSGAAAARHAALAEAGRQLPPIPDSSALAQLKKFIAGAQHSPDKKVRANAGLVAGLAGVVLGI